LNGDLDVIEGKDSDELNLYESKLPDGVKLELTKVTYNIDGGEEKTLDKSGAVFSRENGTMQEGKTTHFTYHYRVVKDEKITNTENLKGSVVVKYVNTDGVEIKNPVTIKDNVDAGQRLTKTITSGTAELGSKTDTVDGTTKYEANTVKEDRIEKDGKTYALIRVLPKDDKLKNTDQVEGVVKPGTTTIIYEYREVEKGNVVVNYYLENTTTKLADSETQTPSYYGTDYKTTAKTIQPKVEIKDTPEKTITTTTTYELVEKPVNAEGKVSAEQTVVNYYYRAVTKEDVVLKQAPVTVNYYKEGTTEKLADSVDKGQKQIGSKYMTDAASIEPKVEKVVENGHVVTRTTTYELVKVPEDKDGIVPTGGKVVNYYYREVVKEVAKPNDAPKVDIPEFNGGVPPLDPPVVDIPEYKELIGIPGEPEVHEKTDFKGGVTPLDPPVVEIPEFNGGVPGIPEVHEKPEFKGGVPGVPEIHEKPEFKGGVVPNDAPIHEKPEAKIPDVKPIAPMSEKPKVEKPTPKEPVFVPIVETPAVETPVVQPKVDKPQTPEIVAKESVLPNTAGGDNLAINVLGALTLASVLGLAAVKRKEEE
jgi:LPXTG-motif cell wall anchor domain protein